MRDHEHLIDAYLDGTLQPEEEAPLQSLLREDAEARSMLRRRAAIDEHLSDLAQVIPLPSSKPKETVSFSSPRWSTIIPWSIAALLMLGLIADRFPSGSIDSQKPVSFVGLLVDEAEAEVAPDKGPDEVRFDPGDYQLTRGAVHVRFENGADIVMKAPASFRSDDSLHLALKDGGLRAIIPPSAQGFTVATPGIDYEDLGTEFGVSVDEFSGASQLHVFDGQVDAKAPGSKELLSSIFAGETLEHSDGKLTTAETPADGTYPQPGEIGYLRWQLWKDQLVEDSSLIAFFPFARVGDSPELLDNQIDTGIVSDGKIQQARWVSGRWPGKQALLFDRPNNRDAVALNLSGSYEELTISSWLKVNRFDHGKTSLINSDGWKDGGLHLQFSRSAHIQNGFFSIPRKPVREVGKPVDLGKWRHVVSVISQPQGTSEIYIDGEIAHQSALSSPGLLAPGSCQLGNWLRRPDWPHSPVRAFKGRIDELAIWNRALSKSEIEGHYEAGRPNLIDD